MKFPKNYAFQLQNDFFTSQKSLLNVSFVQKNQIMVSFKFQHAFENECNLNGNFVLYFTHLLYFVNVFFIFSRFLLLGIHFLGKLQIFMQSKYNLNLCIDYFAKNIHIKLKQKLVQKMKEKTKYSWENSCLWEFFPCILTYFLFRY